MLVVGAVPGVASGNDEVVKEKVYLSLGDSLAMGAYADADGVTQFPSNKSYTDRLYRKIKGAFGGNLTHVKLGCDGEKTTDMIYGTETKCDDGSPRFAPQAGVDYVTGTQLGDAVMWLTDPDVEVVLVTITIGANDINHLAGVCGFDPGCMGVTGPTTVGPPMADIFTNLGIILGTIRGTGYTGPIIGTEYYNPNVTASVGFFAGRPGPLPPDAGFAALSDGLTQLLNAYLAAYYGAFWAHTADVYAAFASGDFGDDGAKHQKKDNGVFDNADAACKLVSMCPKKPGAKANIHPTKKGYKVMMKAFLSVIREHGLV
jgi:lysophospholipase L1-like esterase